MRTKIVSKRCATEECRRQFICSGECGQYESSGNFGCLCPECVNEREIYSGTRCESRFPKDFDPKMSWRRRQ